MTLFTGGGRFDGIGFALMDTPFAAFDLDDCIDADGAIAAEARALVEECGSYAERTPSGRGLRVIGFGNGAPIHTNHNQGSWSLESYRGATRYITISGDVLEGFNKPFVNIDAAIDRMDKPRVEASSFIDEETLTIIREGVAIGERSEAFQTVVNRLYRLGFSVEDIEKLLHQYPNGVAKKYQGRLEKEVQRSWSKARQFDEKPAPAKTRLGDFNALRNREFAPVRFIVPDYIPEGLTPLVGSPKIGKSWMTLDTAFAVASGGETLGVTCETGDVLLLALEDNERRLQSRTFKMRPDAAVWPERLRYATEWPLADDGGLAAIRDWLIETPEARLVVVDVLGRFRSGRKKVDTLYEGDYAALVALQKLASEFRVAIVVVHHTRKGAALDDPFEKVSGTQGLAGAADAVAILSHNGQGTTLYGRGRDIETFDVAIKFNPDTCVWDVLGEATAVRRSDERAKILGALLNAGEGGMTAGEIAGFADMKEHNVRNLLSKMVAAGEVQKLERGRYGVIRSPG